MGLIENLERIKELVENGATGGGGGSEDWEFSGVGYLFYSGQNTNKFNELIKHFPTQTKSLSYTFYGGGWITEEQLKKVLSLDLSELTNLSYAFYSSGASCNVDTTYYINIPKCTGMANAFYSFNTPLANLDFDGTTGNVVDYNATFNSCKIKGILNINMDKISNNYTFFNSSSFDKLTFKGTFGGQAATPSLTLNLSQLNSNAGYNKESFIETITTLSANESGKTRIIKVKSDIYNALSEEEIAIATNKGYTIST